MRSLIILVLIIFSFAFIAQEEKRLALVIGNANYDKGALKNPVNDAELVAKTLDSLNFDVILKKNLEYRSQFVRAIREFGQKRAEYDVAFVYYAGHGIQVDNENFLLPTKEEFMSEDDVLDFGVSVQNVLRYLESESEKVNILILDACRDNPFEVEWNATRSIKGSGLAKIPPPTGSLIAFSTDAGSTAADGASENSVYCKSLCKNFLLEDVSIDQVFRNVRSDVLKSTNNKQRPVESSQLTGNTFYLNLTNFDKLRSILDAYLLEEKFDSANIIANQMIFNFADNALSYAKKGHVMQCKKEFNIAFENYLKAYKLDSNIQEIYTFTIFYEGYDLDLGLRFLPLKFERQFEKIINKSFYTIYREFLYNNSENPYAYLEFSNMEDNDSCISMLHTALNFCENFDDRKSTLKSDKSDITDPKVIILLNISHTYKFRQLWDSALKYSNVTEGEIKKIDSKSTLLGHIYQINSECYFYKHQYEKSLIEARKSIELINEIAHGFLLVGKNYDILNNYDSAIFYKNIAIEKSMDNRKALYFIERGISNLYFNNEFFAIQDFQQAIQVDNYYEDFSFIGNMLCAIKFEQKSLFCKNYKSSIYYIDYLENKSIKNFYSEVVKPVFDEYFDLSKLESYLINCN